uniref:Uncharacterized protein n=1 Tax=viral metagenome TaxID=1070528 RepID=A0A6C0APT7_9ZZZZ
MLINIFLYKITNTITMISVNSFDIFDTILARKTVNSFDIFTIIEETFPYQNFKEMREYAQSKSNNTIDDIYSQFKQIYSISDNICNNLKEYEIQMECKYCYKIETNYNRVNNGDILISDMYLREKDIWRILNAIGFTKNVSLYVTPGGKRLGTIWPQLKEKYSIKLHLGDNLHSDIHMAKMAGINTEYTDIHSINDVEQFFIQNNFKNFALMLRKFRHANPYDKNSLNFRLYNDQAIYNIPTLILLSTTLYNILKNENRTSLLLLTRDGCLLQHIFRKMYPEIYCINLQSSRFMHINPNDEYKNYLKQHYNHSTCLIFDLFGSFKSGRELYKELFGEYPRVHVFGFFGSEYNGLTYSSNYSIEYINLDVVGSLITMQNGEFIRAPIIEYEIDDAYIYRNTVLSFCNSVDLFSIEDNIPRVELLSLFINTINFFKNTGGHCCHNSRLKKLNSSQRKVFSLNKPHNSLTDIADKLLVHKGSIAQCGHRYTDYYQYIFNKFYNMPLINILEIGLYLYGTRAIPSLELWHAYYGKQCKVYGFDSNPEFLKFTIPNEIEIYIGNQENPSDIEQCYKESYDIIIDDGPHTSKGQQIMFKTIWKALNYGGVYCIESLHYHPKNDTAMKTKDLLLQWKQGNVCSSDFISLEEAKEIYLYIDTIEFYPSKSKKWEHNILTNALCIITKKQNEI